VDLKEGPLYPATAKKKCQVPIREGLLPFSRTPPLQSHSFFYPSANSLTLRPG